jgi:hypothetical protein
VRRFPLFALGIVAACSKTPASDAARTDSAGVEIVTNTGIDRVLTWPVEAMDTIYDPATDTMLQGEARMLSLGADARGQLAFADGGFNDRRVIRRGVDGVLHQVGRRGGGPGEYQMPSSIAVAPDGELLVSDFSKHSFLRYGVDDAILPPVPWSAFGDGFIQFGGYGGGGIVAVLSEMSESTSVKRIVQLSATDTTLLGEVHESAPKQLMYESCHVGFMGAPLFYPAPSWSGNHELVALVTTGRYEIVLWHAGHPVRIIRRPLPPRAATKALAIQDVGDGFRIILGDRGPCVVPPEEIVAQQGYAPTIPAIKRLTMATDGTLWVERYTVKGESPLRDIFDPSGAYLGTLQGEIPWPQAWLPDGQFVAVGADADSLPVVVRYAVGGAVRKE